MNYKDAVRKINADYRYRINEYRQLETELFETDAQFRASEIELRDLVLRSAKGENVSRELNESKKKNEQLRRKLNLVPPAPRCSRCGDTGIVGGKFCECAIRYAVNESSGELGIPLHDFGKVDYEIYGEFKSQYVKLFDDINTICTLYPNNKKRCIIIGGGTGCGKTYLAGCAAQKILERGLSVMALTAFAANDRFLKYHTDFGENKADYLEPLLDCSMLIIDDLGTESILKNVSLEYLYQVINERNTMGKLTLITTNLTPDRLLSRYGERIYSRLFDKSLSYATYLKAADIRKAF